MINIHTNHMVTSYFYKDSNFTRSFKKQRIAEKEFREPIC